jgi:hypothetical protein
LFKEECENIKPYAVMVKYGYSSCTGTIIKSNSNKSYVLSMVSPLDYYAESEWNMVKPTRACSLSRANTWRRPTRF